MTLPVNNTFVNSDFLIDASCEDNNDTLFINYSMFRVDTPSVIIQSFENNSNLTEFLTIKDTILVSPLSGGLHQINFTCADAHTNKLFRSIPREIDVAEGWIKFKEDERVINITLIESPVAFRLNYMSSKCEDYSCNFVYADTDKKVRGNYTFELQSTDKLTYHPLSSYKGHFTTRVNWVDFVNRDSEAKYEVTKINDRQFRIRIDTDDLNFSSLGGLNFVNEFLHFFVDKDPPTKQVQLILLT